MLLQYNGYYIAIQIKYFLPPLDFPSNVMNTYAIFVDQGCSITFEQAILGFEKDSKAGK